ncbi:MAG: hypothetical protein ACRCSC_01790 [Lactococcus garvieae]
MLLDSNFSQYDPRDLRIEESYEKISESAAIKYAIGAMAAVDSNSTRISIQEGERVADTLISMLGNAGIQATKEIQGSVALDIHILGHSDVDMLILKKDIVLVEIPKLDGSLCEPLDQRPMKEIIRELRLTSEEKLTTRYYEATVDCSGNKSIALSGGSLKRKVDIVPACWYHTHDYQKSSLKHDKEVKIYHKANHELVGNKPFMHIKKVNDKDLAYSGNLKKVTRLMKNLVADMPNHQKERAAKLSSYDLTALAYSMDDKLCCQPYMSLALVEKLRAYLFLLVSSKPLRDGIWVPDGSRKVFNEATKLEALQIISSEVDDLAKAIYKDIVPFSSQKYDSAALDGKYVFL